METRWGGEKRTWRTSGPLTVEFVNSQKEGVGFCEFRVAATGEGGMIMGVVASLGATKGT
jgi:hypothetical protein